MVGKNIDKVSKDLIAAQVDLRGGVPELELLRRADLTDAARQAAQIAAQYVVEGSDAFKNAAGTYRNVADALKDANDIEGANSALKTATDIENAMTILSVIVKPPKIGEEDASGNVNET